ncbi:membrane protein [Prevotella herbatica]|uniref:Membrane protein n=1 Tax=Prevotella herbatica TaxID=2801997 RepID=A0ABM7NV46_9BACT|nr:ABC transporter permease [Prevotella herbatica]BCS84382.1 membrane protein [Prevotella herbatica]
MRVLKQIYSIAIRECGILMKNPIYGFCMVLFPTFVVFFFTSLMNKGLPTDMPVGIVDLDHTATTRSMIRHLDAFQTTKVVAEYNNVNEARQAIQENKIYAFLYIPRGTTDGLMTSSQPKISFYYSNVTLVAGSMLFRDLKTISSLGSASIGKTKLSAFGKTDDEIKTYLQPVAIDLHMIGNPWSNYNVYLSTVMVPGILMLFIFLLTPYSIGTELKFKHSKEWFAMAGNNPWIAIAGKLLPQFMIFLTIFYLFELYIYYILGFPHPGGVFTMLLLGFLAVISAQGFGVFAFGLMPSLRMSMSICSLWAVVSFSTSGATYPAFSMNPIIQGLTNLFPLRHYYMIYQINIFNGYPLMDAWFSISALILFALLPIFVMGNIKRAMLLYVYIP